MQWIVSQPLYSVLAEVGLGDIEIHETYARVCDCKVAIVQLGDEQGAHDPWCLRWSTDSGMEGHRWWMRQIGDGVKEKPKSSLGEMGPVVLLFLDLMNIGLAASRLRF